MQGQQSKPSNPKYPYFEESSSAEVVNARISDNADPRLREVMTVLVKHLHAAIKEIEPTHEEWLTAINFLTETGHMCTQWRQEYILLSDVLGVSMLVDAINHHHPSGATENTILGPFYVPDAPRYENGANICLDHKGDPLAVKGGVINTSGKPIPGALIDVWQTNDDGFYDVQQKGTQPDWNLRGVFTADENGEILVQIREASVLSHPQRWSRRQAVGRSRASSQPGCAHPFYCDGPRIRSDHHSYLYTRLSLSFRRCGFRRKRVSDR